MYTIAIVKIGSTLKYNCIFLGNICNLHLYQMIIFICELFVIHL